MVEAVADDAFSFYSSRRYRGVKKLFPFGFDVFLDLRVFLRTLRISYESLGGVCVGMHQLALFRNPIRM